MDQIPTPAWEWNFVFDSCLEQNGSDVRLIQTQGLPQVYIASVLSRKGRTLEISIPMQGRESDPSGVIGGGWQELGGMGWYDRDREGEDLAVVWVSGGERIVLIGVRL